MTAYLQVITTPPTNCAAASPIPPPNTTHPPLAPPPSWRRRDTKTGCSYSSNIAGIVSSFRGSSPILHTLTLTRETTCHTLSSPPPFLLPAIPLVSLFLSPSGAFSLSLSGPPFVILTPFICFLFFRVA